MGRGEQILSVIEFIAKKHAIKEDDVSWKMIALELSKRLDEIESKSSNTNGFWSD